MRQRAKDKMWDASFIKDDQVWDDWANEWKDELSNEVINVNQDYAMGTLEVGFGTDGLGTITTQDFVTPRRVWVTYNGVDKFSSTKTFINQVIPNQVFSSAHPMHAWRGDEVIRVFPSDTSGTAEIHFYRFGTTLVNDTDVLPFPMRAYTKSFTDYMVGQAKYKDQKMEEGDRRIAIAEKVKEQFTQNLAPKDKSGPSMIHIVENISGEDGFIP